jgi:ABC-type dipeptide/oligopeptide/nickel transport system permease subunit
MWPQYARMSEAVAATVLRESHVEAARLAGFSEPTILVRHVLPRVLRTIMPLATLGVGQAIMSISALGFLGLGLKPPTPEWGAMINELLPFLHEGPAQMAAPCFMIFVCVLVLTLSGRALAGRAEGAQR